MRSFVDRYHGGLAFGAGARRSDLTIERLFDAPDLQGPSLRQTRFSPDGARVGFLRGGKERDRNRLDLWAYDVATARRAPGLIRRAARQGVLSAEEKARRERQRIAALRGIRIPCSPDPGGARTARRRSVPRRSAGGAGGGARLTRAKGTTPTRMSRPGAAT